MGAQFLQNQRFQKWVGKCWIWEVFWEAQAIQNQEKHVYKNICFFNIEFSGFFLDFDSILAGRDVPAWSLQSPYKSVETLIFRMLGRIAAQESYQGRFQLAFD